MGREIVHVHHLDRFPGLVSCSLCALVVGWQSTSGEYLGGPIAALATWQNPPPPDFGKSGMAAWADMNAPPWYDVQ